MWYCMASGVIVAIVAMGLLPDTENCGLRMRRECRERLVIPTCIKARASRMCCDASKGLQTYVSLRKFQRMNLSYRNTS